MTYIRLAFVVGAVSVAPAIATERLAIVFRRVAVVDRPVAGLISLGWSTRRRFLGSFERAWACLN